MQLVHDYLDGRPLLGEDARVISNALGGLGAWTPYEDGFSIPLGRYPDCPKAREHWLVFGVGEQGIVESVVLSDERGEHSVYPIGPRPWRRIPFEVSTRLADWDAPRLDGGPVILLPDWGSEYDRDDLDDPLLVVAKARAEHGALLLSIKTNSDGYYGNDLELRLALADDGSKELIAQGSNWSHIGNIGDDPLEALHGVVEFAQREPGSRDPLRIRLLIGGVSSNRFRMGHNPDLIWGDLEIEIPKRAEGPWEQLLANVNSLSAEMNAPNLVAEELLRLDGSLVAKGQIDGQGRRWGRWLGFYRSGVVAWEADYRGGLLHGEWRMFTREGELDKVRAFRGGLREEESR